MTSRPKRTFVCHFGIKTMLVLQDLLQVETVVKMIGKLLNSLYQTRNLYSVLWDADPASIYA